eukprot:6188930-Pleurochrysis_carterae.AAC.1
MNVHYTYKRRPDEPLQRHVVHRVGVATRVPAPEARTPAVDPMKLIARDYTLDMFKCHTAQNWPTSSGLGQRNYKQHIPNGIDPRDPSFEASRRFDKGNYRPGQELKQAN